MAIGVFALAVLPFAALSAQDDTIPQPPVPLKEGEVFINPKPGIAAPAIEEGTVGTQTVTGSRGYGDASFSWFLQNITAWGTTWLNHNAPGNHNVCVQVITVDVNGAGQGGTSYQCGSRSPGGSLNTSHTVFAACGAYVATRTSHQISTTGYNWGPTEDFDSTTFCS